MNKDCVIIGGGVAGLCAAIRLTELGVRPLVVESGNYPSHKVCGEFFSPESLTLLEKWNIHPIAVKQAQFYAGSKSLDFTFPVPAGGLSHIEFDPLLVQRAREGGAEILTGTKVVQLRSGSPYHEIELSTGEVIQSPDLIVATGRIPQFHSTPVMRYMGIKAHFEGLFPENTLSMFFFDGAYVGMSPVENGQFNVACLAKIEKVNEWKSPQAFMEHLMAKNKVFGERFAHGKCLFSSWMSVSAPEFGVKETPNWPNAYFIGDAAGSIPPVTGDGMSMAIRGGVLAAEFVVRKDPSGFKKRWHRQCATTIRCGKILHRIAMNPMATSGLMKVGQLFPSLIYKIFQMTRG